VSVSCRSAGARCGETGQGLIELAVALPVLLAIVSAIIDGGWAFYEAASLASAASSAARAVSIQETGRGVCAGEPPESDEAAALAAAAAAAPTLNSAALTVTLSYLEPACVGRMRTVVVSLAYSVTSLTPWFAPLLDGRTLTAQTADAVEEVPPPWWQPSAGSSSSSTTQGGTGGSEQ
jgi:Flp pilus assembly protein TadG